MITEVDFETKFELQMLMEQEKEYFFESNRDAWEHEWQMLVENMDSEDFHAEFLAMKQSREEQIREFEIDFYISHTKDKVTALERRNAELEAQLEQRDLELCHARGDLEIEKGYSAHLKDARLCPECKARL